MLVDVGSDELPKSVVFCSFQDSGKHFYLGDVGSEELPYSVVFCQGQSSSPGPLLSPLLES